MGEIGSIISTVLLVITALVVIHVLGLTALGLRRSWKRSIITLGRCLVAVILAFITAKLLAFPISAALGSLIEPLVAPLFANGIESLPTLFGFISGIPGAIAIPFIFVLLFVVYYLLLLIPQIFVKKAVLKDEIAAKKEKRKPEISWGSRWISAGIKFANSVIILLVVMLPLSCFLAVVDDAYVSIDSLVQSITAGDEEFVDTGSSDPIDVYDDTIAPVTKSPLIVVSSNPVARFIYSNLTEIRVGDTVCYLDQEILSLCDVAGNVTAFTSADISEFGEEQKTAIKNIATYISESDFRCTLICELLATFGEQLPESDDATSSIIVIFTEATPETLATDLNALADIIGTLIDHDVFASLSEDADPNAILDKFGSKEFLSDLLTAVNPSQNCRNLIPSLISTAFASLAEDAEVPAATDVPELTPEQITAEATTLSEIFTSLKEIANTSEEGGSDIADFDAAAFGSIYDKSQESILLKDNFKSIFIALLRSEALESLGDLADILIDHIENDPNFNLTKVLTATQQLSKIFDRYSNGNSATDMIALKNDLNTLINSVDASTADILNEVLESEMFASSSISGGADSKSTQLLTTVINTMVDMQDLSDEELEQEAKALDYLLKISNAKSESVESVFDGEGDNADEMMDTILNSNISSSAITAIAYDEEGNLTGDALELSDSLTEEDKQEVNESAEKYYKENVGSMTAEEKELLQKNMNAIGAIFGTDYSASFSDWDSEIAG